MLGLVQHKPAGLPGLHEGPLLVQGALIGPAFAGEPARTAIRARQRPRLPTPASPSSKTEAPVPQTDPSPEHWAREHEEAWSCPQKGPPHARHSTDTWEGPTPEPQGLRETALHAEQGPLTRSRPVRGGDCGNVAPPGPEGGMQPAGPQPHRYPMVPVPLLLRSHHGLAVVASSISQTPSKPTCFSPATVTA